MPELGVPLLGEKIATKKSFRTTMNYGWLKEGFSKRNRHKKILRSYIKKLED